MKRNNWFVIVPLYKRDMVFDTTVRIGDRISLILLNQRWADIIQPGYSVDVVNSEDGLIYFTGKAVQVMKKTAGNIVIDDVSKALIKDSRDEFSSRSDVFSWLEDIYNLSLPVLPNTPVIKLELEITNISIPAFELIL